MYSPKFKFKNIQHSNKASHFWDGDERSSNVMHLFKEITTRVQENKILNS